MTLRGADVHGADCPTPGLTYEVGAPKAPSASDPGMSVVNGEAGAVVSCYVHGMGPFNFSGMLRATAQGSQHDPISVVFDAGEIGSDYRGTATVTVFTPQLGAAFASSQPCTITVINQQVKNGAIWATFSCPQVSSPPSGLCAASGTIVFENCNGT